ncbi:MAG: MerR family transcriptional regulator, partial [Lentisphaeria bacterium]|nr:MerR family transcriptional regulator [Lentisphaeria bacterium]
MSSNKSYLVSDLAAELNIPRTTVNDWLKIYGPYLESELRGKRKVYPERSLRILQEIKTMRDNGAS